MSSSKWLFLFFGAFCLSLAACRNPIAPPLDSIRYYISPDTATVSVQASASFGMYCTDSHWQPSEVVWTFGDGTAPLTTYGSTKASHAFTAAGRYSVTAIAKDSAGSTLAQSSGVVFAVVPITTVSLSPHTLSIGSSDPVRFTATVSPALPVTLVWTFSDGTRDTTTPGHDSIDHAFNSDGAYSVAVAAYYGTTLVGSDTARVQVTLPTTTINNLIGFLSVRFDYLCGSHSLPLANTGKNSFVVTGNSFVARYDDSTYRLTTTHLGVVVNSQIDRSVVHHSIAASLGHEGRYLTSTRTVWYQNQFSSSNSCGPEYQSTTSTDTAIVDTLYLTSICADSVVFATRKSTCHDHWRNYSDGWPIPPLPISAGDGTVTSNARLVFLRVK